MKYVKQEFDEYLLTFLPTIQKAHWNESIYSSTLKKPHHPFLPLQPWWNLGLYYVSLLLMTNKLKRIDLQNVMWEGNKFVQTKHWCVHLDLLLTELWKVLI